MRASSIRSVAWIVCLAAAAGSVLRASAHTGTDVVVRVYDLGDTGTPIRDAALEVAGQVLASADVRPVWLLCPAAGFACEVPPAAGERMLHFVPSRGTNGPWNRLILGDALIDAHAGGVLARIYVDRVRSQAAKSGADLSVLLGRVVAHELGHLLLGSTAHSATGLMRARWLPDELRRNRPADWVFTARETALMRAHPRTPSARARSATAQYRENGMEGAGLGGPAS